MYLTGASASAVQGLSAFTSLASIDLNAPSTDTLELQALNALPCLYDLFLEDGIFTDVYIGSSLTQLNIINCQVLCSGDTAHAAGLQDLTVMDSTLSLLHAGLAACTALRSLHVADCSVAAALAQDSLSLGPDRQLCVPLGISALARLSTLQISLDSVNTKHFELNWMYSLQSLISLDVLVEGSFDVNQDFTQLRNLTYLELCVANDDDAASYDIDWSAMQTLKQVCLMGPVVFNEKMLHLTKLMSLDTLSLWNLRPRQATASHLARLAYKMATHCSGVALKFIIDGDSVA